MGPSHKAPYRSPELTAYFEGKMDEFAKLGGRHLVFTPPTTRGSLITRCEAWAINIQRDHVPTLADMGRWPLVNIGDHPEVLSREQTEWLSRFWGDCAHKWTEAGCPGCDAPTDLQSVKKDRARAVYKDLVMQTFNDFEHQDRRDFLERKSSVERAARNRL